MEEEGDSTAVGLIKSLHSLVNSVWVSTPVGVESQRRLSMRLQFTACRVYSV